MPNSNQLPEYLTKWTGFVLSYLTNLTKGFYAKGLASINLTPPQFALIQTLANMGAQVQAHLSTPMQIDKATMVGLINDLEGKGLVQRLPHPQDRRAVLVHLTDAGREMVQRAEAVNQQMTDMVFATLTPDEQRTLHDLLVRVAEHMTTLVRPNLEVSNHENNQPK